MKKEITNEAESEFWKSKQTKKQIQNFKKKFLVPDDHGCWMDDEAIREEIVDELTLSLMDHFDYDDEAEFDNDYFKALSTPLDEIIEDVVDDVLLVRDAAREESLKDSVA